MKVNKIVKQTEKKENNNIKLYTVGLIWFLVFYTLAGGFDQKQVETVKEKYEVTYTTETTGGYKLDFKNLDSACNYLHEKYESFDGYECTEEKLIRSYGFTIK